MAYIYLFAPGGLQASPAELDTIQYTITNHPAQEAVKTAESSTVQNLFSVSRMGIASLWILIPLIFLGAGKMVQHHITRHE